MRTRRPRVKRSKGRVPQARKPPRRPRPSKPRRKPEKPRGSETGRVARTRAGCWATWETPSQDARDTSPTLPWPEPGTSEGLRPLHAFAIAELRRTPCMRTSQNPQKAKFAEFPFHALGCIVWSARSHYAPNWLLGTDSPEEDGGGVHPLRPREEGREVGAFSGYVVRKALIVAQEVSAGHRGSLHVERDVRQPHLRAVLRAPRAVAPLRSVAVDHPVICRQRVRIRCVVAEIVVGDRNSPVLRHVNCWRECLLVAGRDVGRRVVDLHGGRPGKAPVGRGRERDAVVPAEKALGEALVLPDGVELAAVRVDRDVGDAVAGADRVTVVWVDHAGVHHPLEPDGARPRPAVVLGAHNGHVEKGSTRPANVPDEGEDVNELALRTHRDLIAQGLREDTRVVDDARILPASPAVGGSREQRRPPNDRTNRGETVPDRVYEARVIGIGGYRVLVVKPIGVIVADER